MVSKEDFANFNNINKQSKGKITQKKIPSDAEIENIKLNRILDDSLNSIKIDNLEKYIKIIKKKSSADISSEKIAAALLRKLGEN